MPTANGCGSNKPETEKDPANRTPAEPHTGAELDEALLEPEMPHSERVTFLKLTHQSEAVTNAILCDPGLRKAKNRMQRHGCDVSPRWANGGLLFFPYNVEDLEVNGHTLEFQREHIVIANKDLSALAMALLTVAEEDRPGIWLEEDRDMADRLLDSDNEADK